MLIDKCLAAIVSLHSFKEKGRIIFQAESNALISAGLAYLLMYVYSGEKPETILKNKPTYLEELEITNSLTRISHRGNAG